MAINLVYIPSPTTELSLEWVQREFDEISSSITDDQFVEIAPLVVGDSPYTVQDRDVQILADTAGGPITINLPLARDERILYIKNIATSGTNNVIVVPNGSDDIDRTGVDKELFPMEGIRMIYSEAEQNWFITSKLNGTGGGSGDDHGFLTGLADDDHLQYVHKDITRNITVGYTTDVEADSFVDPLVPDLALEHLKTLTVTSNFTINEPTSTGHCEYYLTVTGTGPYTITPGTGVKYVGTLPSLTVGTNYVLNVRRYGSSQTVIQVVSLT